MMAAMGYREGSGLGAAGTGRAEPIDVVIKQNRTGLGIEEAKREQVHFYILCSRNPFRQTTRWMTSTHTSET